MEPTHSFDIDGELEALQRAAIAKLDGLLPEITRGQGVQFRNLSGPGNLMLTRPAPLDAQELEGDAPFFRITAIDAAGEPYGHTVVGKGAYRAFRTSGRDADAPGRLCDVIGNFKDSLRPDLTRGLVGIVMGLPTEYTYRLRYREHGIGSSQVLGFKSASGRDLSFARPLTSAELAEFEIDPIGAQRLTPPIREPRGTVDLIQSPR